MEREGEENLCDDAPRTWRGKRGAQSRQEILQDTNLSGALFHLISHGLEVQEGYDDEGENRGGERTADEGDG